MSRTFRRASPSGSRCRSVRPARVLVVSHEASRTGAPRVAVHLASVFADSGWDVDVVLRWGGPLRSEFESVAGAVFDEPFSRLRAAMQRNSRTKRLIPILERWAARRVLRRLQPDLVWCNTVISAPYAAASAEVGIPAVLHSHEHLEVVSRRLRNAGLDDGLAIGSGNLTLVACAPATAEILAVEAGVETGSVHVIRSPVDLAAVRSTQPRVWSDDRPIVVAVGLGNRSKGIDVFCAAAKEHEHLGHRTRWCWVGRTPDEGIETGQVELVGEVGSALPEMAGADVVVLPSRADAFPLVVLEAMALGRPIVASDLPGPREQLGDTGVLIPPEDPIELESSVRRLLENPTEARRLGESARARCEQRWGLEPFAAQVLQLAEQLTGPAAERAVRVITPIGRLSPGGGIQIVVRKLASALDADRVDLQMVVAREVPDIDRLGELGRTVHRLDVENRRSLYGRLRVMVGVARVARQVRPDVLHLHSGTAWFGLLARLVVPGTAVVIEVHDAPGSGHRGSFTELFESWWCRSLGAIAICHSSAVEVAVRNRWKVPRSCVLRFPLFVDTQVFSPVPSESRSAWRSARSIPESMVVVAVVGRLVPTKRMDDAIRAVATARRAGADVGLVVIGRGPSKAALENVAEEEGVSDSVWFTGVLYGDDLVAALGSTDVLCSTSDHEGFGLTIVEGMALGLPVVATGVGGVPDLIVDGTTGFVVSTEDGVEGVASRLSELVADADLRARMGRDGLERARQSFSTDVATTNFEDAYRSAAGRAQLRQRSPLLQQMFRRDQEVP